MPDHKLEKNQTPMYPLIEIIPNEDRFLSRSSGCEPIGRCVRQRTSASWLRKAQDRPAGAAGRPPVRHLAAAPRITRMRLKNPDALLRDGLHPAGIGRHQQQAQGSFFLNDSSIGLSWVWRITWYPPTNPGRASSKDPFFWAFTLFLGQ